jgi:hypothetical protein
MSNTSVRDIRCREAGPRGTMVGNNPSVVSITSSRCYSQKEWRIRMAADSTDSTPR